MLRRVMTANPTPQQIHRIVLAGFMGAGKTTVGQALARRLGWTFADLDHVVSAQLGLTVPEIFVQQGEAAFRAAEATALVELLDHEQTVIALGGGAPQTPAVRDLLRAAPGTAIVHLYAPFPVLFARCLAQAQDGGATERPLLGARAAAAERFERRHPVYASLAHYTANAEAAADLTVYEILNNLPILQLS